MSVQRQFTALSLPQKEARLKTHTHTLARTRTVGKLTLKRAMTPEADNKDEEVVRNDDNDDDDDSALAGYERGQERRIQSVARGSR